MLCDMCRRFLFTLQSGKCDRRLERLLKETCVYWKKWPENADFERYHIVSTAFVLPDTRKMFFEKRSAEVKNETLVGGCHASVTVQIHALCCWCKYEIDYVRHFSGK